MPNESYSGARHEEYTIHEFNSQDWSNNHTITTRQQQNIQTRQLQNTVTV